MRAALKAQHLERRWAGQALEHQLKYNQLIIDSIGELVFVLTKSLSITRINPAVTRFGGYSTADVVRAPILRLISLTPPATNGEEVSLAEALRDGRSLNDVAAGLRTKSGAVLRVRLSFAPLTDENRIVGAVVTLRVDEADLPPRA
jgi:PAS domain S-box-containing protein